MEENGYILKEVYIKVVLTEKLGKEYHFSNLETVKKNWKEGKHPEECKGVCNLTNGFMMKFCTSCGWDYF